MLSKQFSDKIFKINYQTIKETYFSIKKVINRVINSNYYDASI